MLQVSHSAALREGLRKRGSKSFSAYPALSKIAARSVSNTISSRHSIIYAIVGAVLTLVLGVSANSGSWESGAQCSGEAKVSIERNGPNGTFAGDR